MKGCLENALRVPWGVRGKNEAKPCFSIFWRKNKKKIFCFFPLASDVTVRFDAAQTLKSRLKGKTEPNRQNFFEIWSEGDLTLSRQKNCCFQTFLTNQQSFWTEKVFGELFLEILVFPFSFFFFFFFFFLSFIFLPSFLVLRVCGCQSL